jgi:POT family proton-dependent oligopeptide transporter
MSNSPDTRVDPIAYFDKYGFFGHPRGLSTLFYTEMWERFSYYGMRAILTLYMTKTLAEGGLAFDEKYASVIYATYVSSVWYLPLIGGWLADKIFGARRAVLIGGIIIACGHYSMAIDTLGTFYAGLILIACGTGLLKPNISAMVGQLYGEADARRDAGFSIFYMGINLGAFLSPLVVGFLAQAPAFKNFITSMGFSANSTWHWGFGAAGVGMTLGIIQYLIPFSIRIKPSIKRYLASVIVTGAVLSIVSLIFGWSQVVTLVADFAVGLLVGYLLNRWRAKSDRGKFPEGKSVFIIREHSLRNVGRRVISKADSNAERLDVVTLGLAISGGVVGTGLGFYFGDAGFLSALFPAVVGFFAGYLIGTTRALNGDELKRVLVIFILFLFSIFFWMTYEQAGSSLTLFADRMTSTTILGWQYPSSWFQAVPAIFVILLAPVMAVIWQGLGRRQPSSPGKFTIGLLFAGIAFVVIAFASTYASGGRVSPMWLIVVYFLQTIGELCLSPVGLSTVTKLAPERMVGLMLGVWFLSISIGSYIAGLTTRLFAGNNAGVLTRAFGIFAGVTILAALVLAVLTPLIKKMTPRSA